VIDVRLVPIRLTGLTILCSIILLHSEW